MYGIYDMNRYKTRLGYSKYKIHEKGCGVVALARYLTFLLDEVVHPVELNQILVENSGFMNGGEIWWLRVAQIFELDHEIELWNEKRGHIDIAKKVFPAIISVDGLKVEGYQTHFVFGKGLIRNKKDILISDPWDEDIKSVMEFYNRGDLRGSVFSYIRFTS
jgi:hypothetical protein